MTYENIYHDDNTKHVHHPTPLDPRPSDLHYKLIVMGIVHIVTVRKVRPAFFPKLLSPDASLNGEL